MTVFPKSRLFPQPARRTHPGPGYRQDPTRALQGLPQRSSEPCRHRSAAPSPRRTDAGAGRQTVRNIARNLAGALDNLDWELGHASAVSCRCVPSPSDPGKILLRDQEFADSPLEGDGFEPLVPQREGTGFSRPPRSTSGPFTSTGSILPRQRDRIASLAIWECRRDAERTVDWPPSSWLKKVV